MPDRFPAVFADKLFFGIPQHHGAVFFDAVVVVAVLAQRNQLTRHAGIPGVGGDVGQVGMRLWVGNGHRLQ
ncbi:hypothetical protein D3C77_676440 [compost metagenome]